MSLEFDIYLLTLSDSKRTDALISLVENNIEFTTVYGINGKNLNINNIKRGVSYLCKLFCTSNIIGAGLSHMFIWKRIMLKNRPGLIIEDDTIVDFDSLKKLYPYLKIHLNKSTTGIIQLSSNNLRTIEEIKIDDKYTLSRSNIHLTIGAYLISPHTAGNIYYKTKVWYHIDMLLNFTGKKNYSITPNIAEQGGWNESSLNIKSKLLNNIHPQIYYSLTFPIIKLPKINIVVNTYFIIIILTLTACIFLKVEPILWIILGLLFIDGLNFDKMGSSHNN